MAFCKCVLDVEVKDERTPRQREFDRYSADWAEHDLAETVKRLVPGAVATQNTRGTKTLYHNEAVTPLMVVEDNEEPYFRVRHTRVDKVNKRFGYTDIEGNLYDADWASENYDEFLRRTHFRKRGE